jgi:hypothetical protein
MKNYKTIKHYVVAELDGKYWGVTYQDGYGTTYGFVSIDDASYHNPEYCEKPTDMTWTPDPYSFRKNDDFDKLKKATLRHVTIETKYSVED